MSLIPKRSLPFDLHPMHVFYCEYLYIEQLGSIQKKKNFGLKNNLLTFIIRHVCMIVATKFDVLSMAGKQYIIWISRFPCKTTDNQC